MISDQNIASLVGADVTDLDGSKIGTVGQIYVDPQTGRPNWATVRTGFFGTKESFVPLDDAEAVDGEIRVVYTKDVVKGAPRIDDSANLNDGEQADLYRYYQGHGRTDAEALDTESDTEPRRPPLRKYLRTRPEAGTIPVEHEGGRIERGPLTEADVLPPGSRATRPLDP